MAQFLGKFSKTQTKKKYDFFYKCFTFIIFSLNTTVADSPFLTSQEEAETIISGAPEGGEVEEVTDIGKIHYLPNTAYSKL